MPESVLVVVAHPDDESLGCGATARALTEAGHDVRTIILSGEVTARAHRPSDESLIADTREASRILGMAEPVLGPFPNIKMNSVPHLELVQFVEANLAEASAQWVITHHPHDLNDDHRQVSSATQAAARLFQRNQSVPPLNGLFFMEIPSSTDWQFPGAGHAFQPNAYFPVTEEQLDAKIAACSAYRGVMRPFPHPRSPEVIRGLAAVRGGQSGLGNAEAFQIAHLQLPQVLG
ncbi:PIG-L deacetylase family protein [Dietzia sp. CH92]|uniref:PIG-L deacetylase family protein n=1 Tax=Dietzia sp. CH92 TaxID=3051823 RepID=UPI0028D231DA|nr:PIG-L deacetylase family protein [Dietzia sp. CH92]